MRRNNNLLSYLARVKGTAKENGIYAIVPRGPSLGRTDCEYCQEVLAEANETEAPFLLLYYDFGFVPHLQCYVCADDIAHLLRTSEGVRLVRVFASEAEALNELRPHLKK